MNLSWTLVIAMTGAVTSILSLVLVLRLSSKQRTEYDFFLREYQAKFDQLPRWPHRLASYNAALGGRAPKWHWIDPVLPPSEDAYTNSH